MSGSVTFVVFEVTLEREGAWNVAVGTPIFWDLQMWVLLKMGLMGFLQFFY